VGSDLFRAAGIRRWAVAFGRNAWGFNVISEQSEVGEHGSGSAEELADRDRIFLDYLIELAWSSQAEKIGGADAAQARTTKKRTA
jgi:hypothetical protein